MRSFFYYWRINLAVMLGAAVACAVLTGALLVGDSVRGSLKARALERLGNISHGLVNERFFREDLAGALSLPGATVAPTILLRGTGINSQAHTRASGVQIAGIDHRFLSHFPDDQAEVLPFLQRKEGQIFPPVVINRSLQQELNVQPGDSILLSFNIPSEINRESVLGKKKTTDILQKIRLTVSHVIPDRGIGLFALQIGQQVPFNAFLSLPTLQELMRQPDKVNALFDDASLTVQEVNQALKGRPSLADLGLTVKTHSDFFLLESSAYFLKPEIEAVAFSVAGKMKAPYLPTVTYLANRIISENSGLPYSTITGLRPTDEAALGTLHIKSGSIEQNADGIILNEWAANDLNVVPGDQVQVHFYEVATGDKLVEKSAGFKVTGIAAMEGLGADATLTPDFPGVHDAEDMSDWDPPFEMDLSSIRPKDESYWDTYKAAPKAFISVEKGLELWQSRFGRYTGIRIGKSPDAGLEETRRQFIKALLNEINPAEAGFQAVPLRVQSLQASSGTTDFGVLFISFSFFIIISAMLLVGLLFRLGVEHRVSEQGLLLAVGFSPRKVLQKYMLEGLIIAGFGSLVGLVAAFGYASLIIYALKTLWVEVIGTPFLNFEYTVLSLAVGYFTSVIVTALSIWLSFRQTQKVPVPLMIAGVISVPKNTSQTKAAWLFRLSLAGCLLLLGASLGFGVSPGIFFGIGALMLTAGLAFISLKLTGGEASRSPQPGPAALSYRNLARNPGRSMLCIALVACACFIIVSVGAFRHTGDHDTSRMDSGTGGFAFEGYTDTPIYQDLTRSEGRFEAGLSEELNQSLASVDILPFRVLPGDDASCLNLYAPQKPQIVGVTDLSRLQGRFNFQAVIEDVDSPWTLLEIDLGDNIVPVVTDFNSAMWILHLKLGDDFVTVNDKGQEIKLRIVGLLKGSIFQSQLLMSEDHFRRHYPDKSGFQYFLMGNHADWDSLAPRMEDALEAYGMDLTSTSRKLEGFFAIENTYISIFQMLGGLGLLLGTFGLGIIIIRNLQERWKEFAVMRAFGFQVSRLAWLLILENGFLMAVGIGLGTLAAATATIPQFISDLAHPSLAGLAVSLAAIFVIGVLVSSLAVWRVLKVPLLPALKR